MKRLLTLSVDFDGCITTGSGRFPIPNPLRNEAKPTLSRWHNYGHKIIINTARSGNALILCKNYLSENGVPYDFINENDPAIIQYWGSDTRKISADLYFDDRSSVVDWKKFDTMVKKFSKPSIICIVGESGSGKSLVADYIHAEYGISLVQSRTTRPPRFDGESGHMFVTDEDMDAYQQKEKIAFTQFGQSRYCCLKSDLKIRNTYVIDEFGLSYLLTNFGAEYNIFSIRMLRNSELRVDKVGVERVARDAGKFKMSQWDFDARIFNHSSKEYLFEKVDEIFTKNMLYI